MLLTYVQLRCYRLFRLRPLQDAGTGVRGEDAMADADPGGIAEMTVSLTL